RRGRSTSVTTQSRIRLAPTTWRFGWRAQISSNATTWLSTGRSRCALMSRESVVAMDMRLDASLDRGYPIRDTSSRFAIHIRVLVDTVCVGPSAESNQSAIVTPSVRYGSLARDPSDGKRRALVARPELAWSVDT